MVVVVVVEASHGPHRSIKPPKHLIHIVQRHCRAEPVMAGGATVVVEIDAVRDRSADEAKHPVALMADDVAVAARGAGDAEIDAEAGTEALQLGGDAMAGE